MRIAKSLDDALKFFIENPSAQLRCRMGKQEVVVDKFLKARAFFENELEPEKIEDTCNEF